MSEELKLALGFPPKDAGTPLRYDKAQGILAKTCEEKRKFDLYRKRPFSCQEISPAGKVLEF